MRTAGWPLLRAMLDACRALRRVEEGGMVVVGSQEVKGGGHRNNGVKVKRGQSPGGGSLT